MAFGPDLQDVVIRGIFLFVRLVDIQSERGLLGGASEEGVLEQIDVWLAELDVVLGEFLCEILGFISHIS